MSPDLTPKTPAQQILPATIDALPRDATRAPQTQFTRALQARFLRRLADCGELRVAAKTLSVSHQTVYRMRRACAVFARGWDAALIVARERAEEMLASRAMHGVEEEVFYHGEVVATRRRYDSRLLLAHLARLDRLAERADMTALDGHFDAVVEAFEDAGEDGEVDIAHLERAPEEGGPVEAKRIARVRIRVMGARRGKLPQDRVTRGPSLPLKPGERARAKHRRHRLSSGCARWRMRARRLHTRLPSWRRNSPIRLTFAAGAGWMSRLTRA